MNNIEVPSERIIPKLLSIIRDLQYELAKRDVAVDLLIEQQTRGAPLANGAPHLHKEVPDPLLVVDDASPVPD